MHSRHALTIVVSIITTGALAPRAFGDELRADVFLCEDAIARARQCCPTTFQMPPADFCDFQQGCGGPSHEPTLTEAEARCVINATCDELRNHRCAVALPCP